MATGLARLRPFAASLPAPSFRAAFLIALAVHAGFVLLVGVSHGSDTVTYSEAADRLIAGGFDYGAAVEKTVTDYPPLLYILFGTLVAVLKLLFGDGWGTALIVLNIAAAAMTAGWLTRIAWRASGNGAAAWAALGLSLAAVDILRWTAFVMSDTTFLLLAFAVFGLAAQRLLSGEGQWWPVFALAAGAAFYRPTGIVLLPCVAWAWFLFRTGPGPLRKAATGAMLAAAAAATLLFAALMQTPALWPVTPLADTVAGTAKLYAIGEVVSARPATYHAAPSSLLDYALISLDRFIHFFAVTAAEFSMAHNLVNTLFFLPLYALAAWFLFALATGRDRLERRQRDLFLAALAFLLMTAAFHGLLQVDFDWRYRLPVLPHLILLAAGGVAVLVRRNAPE